MCGWNSEGSKAHLADHVQVQLVHGWDHVEAHLVLATWPHAMPLQPLEAHILAILQTPQP